MSKTGFGIQVELDQLCAHECHIFSRGLFSPGPTFRIVASDRPDEPLDAKSATGAWNAVLERINSEIRRRCVALEHASDLQNSIGLNNPDEKKRLQEKDIEQSGASLQYFKHCKASFAYVGCGLCSSTGKCRGKAAQRFRYSMCDGRV